MKTKEEIQREALMLFSKYGIRSVRIEDIATNMGVSTRTIYENFESKEDLVLDIIQKYNKELDEQIEEINNNRSNPTIKLLNFYAWRFNVALKFNPLFLVDLKKHYRSAALIYDQMNTKTNELIIRPLLKDMANAGYLFENANLDLIYHYQTIVFEMLFYENSSLFLQFSAIEIFDLFITKNIKSILKIESCKIIEDFTFTVTDQIHRSMVP